MADTNGNGSTGSTGSDLTERNKAGRFLPGHRSLGGRKRGARGKLSERFLADLHAQWIKSGKSVLETVARQEPAVFLKVVSAVLPRAMEVDGVLNVTHRSELAIEVQDFATAYEKWGKYIGANMPLIEAEAIEDDDSIEADDEQSSNGR